MSCDHDLANEWTPCSGKNASYVTTQIKAVTCHKSDASIESYCERPALHQFRQEHVVGANLIHSRQWKHAASVNFIISNHKYSNSVRKIIQPKESSQLAVPKFSRKLGRVSNFNKPINRHHHSKIMLRMVIWPSMSPVLGWTGTKLWTLNHTNVSNFETASNKNYINSWIFYDFRGTLWAGKHSGFHLNFFQIVGPWRGFTVVTKLIKNFKTI